MQIRIASNTVDIPDSSGTFNQILYNVICDLRGEKYLKSIIYRTNVLKKFFEEELSRVAVDEGRYLVVFLDDAQAMGGMTARPSTRKAHLEQIRLLINIDLLDKNLMTIILIGQPELRRYIAQLPQLEDRAAPPCYLNAFDYGTTQDYIDVPNDLYKIAPLQTPTEHCAYAYLYRFS